MSLFLVVTSVLKYDRVLGQNQDRADSLKIVLNEENSLSLWDQASILEQITIFSSSPEDKIKYSNMLLKIATTNDLQVFSIKANLYLGVAYRLKGDLNQSLEHLFLSTELALYNSEYSLLIESYGEVANTYTANSDFKNALSYEKKTIDVLRSHGGEQALAINLLNTGYSYYTLGELDSALNLYNEAEPIFEEIGLSIGSAYTIGNRALIYWKQGNYTAAELDLKKAISMLEPLGDQFGIADYHNQLGKIYLEQEQFDNAIYHTEKALGMAEGLDLKEQIRDASFLLSQLYSQKGNYQQALAHQVEYIAFKDSIENSEQTKKMADLRTEFEVSLREKEIVLLEKNQALQRTYIFIALALLVLAIVLILYFQQRFRTTKLLADAERKQHEGEVTDLLKTQETKALQSMVEGKENERKRLAKELHNHLGSMLATIKVNLNGLDHADSKKQQTIVQLVDQVSHDVRNMSHELNMGVSHDFGLIPALRELVIHLQQSGGLKVEFTASMGDSQISSECEITIYRVIQELVSNVLKHASATRLTLSLTAFEEDHLINILVQDNGKGFDSKRMSDGSKKGIGLNSLKKMVDQMDGEMSIDSNLKKGTTVSIDIPVQTLASTLDTHD